MQNTDIVDQNAVRHDGQDGNLCTGPTHESRHSVFIPLSKGKVAIIDAEDAKRVNQHKWCATVTKRGRWYAKRKVVRDGKATSEMLHRFIMNCPKGFEVDHINNDGLDNRRENLRLCTRSQNNGNRRLTTIKFKGVSWERKSKSWRASIGKDYVNYELGRYKTAEEAAEAYDRAARRLYGQFARVNFPEDGERKAL